MRARLWDRWTQGVHCQSPVAFAFGVSLAWLLFYNVRFWQDTATAMWHGTLASAIFVASLFVLVLCVQALLVLLLPRRLMAAGASGLFLVAAVGAFFSAKYGVVMDEDMMRNVAQTDAAEVHGLMNAALAQWVVLLGILPMLIVWKVRLPPRPLGRAMRQRMLAIGAIMVACTAALLSSTASYAVFFREYKPIRFSLSPAAPVVSGLTFLIERQQHRGNVRLVNASGPAYRAAPVQAKPLVIVIVVGETARAANFQLGGYARATNPRLMHEDGLVYFDDATSCGTSTAISVPCMFSHLGRDEFDVDEAGHYTNLLDALHEAGFDVEWRDNNAGCKGVCARIRHISYADSVGRGACSAAPCHDEVLLEGVGARLHGLHHDTVIVLHALGSHGPAYYQRYPPQFEVFAPACHSSSLQRCSAAEVTNAYDNTIIYADHVLAEAIDRLRGAQDEVDSVLLYASDHGESLGERGLYLHGLPYRFAPDTQKHVPMLLWMSNGYATRRSLDKQCLNRQARAPVSHDNIYHTVLGAAGVRNGSYDAALDILATCADLRGRHE